MVYPKHEIGRTCFVAMPVTTPSFYAEKFDDPEHFAHVLAHLFVPALEEVGLTVIPPSVRGGEVIHAEIIRNLEQADLVLCDLSSLNPNVFFELGIRTSLDRPVALVKDSLTKQIPFDLNAVNTLTYDGSLSPWKLKLDIPLLADHINSTLNNGNPGNSIWRYFGLTKRATPSTAGANPVEAKLDLLLSEFEKFQSAKPPLPVNDRQYMQEEVLPSARFMSFKQAIRAILAANGVHKFDIYRSPREISKTIYLDFDGDAAKKLRSKIIDELNIQAKISGYDLEFLPGS